MKKKTVSPIIYLAIIFFTCILLTVISHYAERKHDIESEKTVSIGTATDQNNDYMIWESVSHHLLNIYR